MASLGPQVYLRQEGTDLAGMIQQTKTIERSEGGMTALAGIDSVAGRAGQV